MIYIAVLCNSRITAELLYNTPLLIGPYAAASNTALLAWRPSQGTKLYCLVNTDGVQSVRPSSSVFLLSAGFILSCNYWMLPPLPLPAMQDFTSSLSVCWIVVTVCHTVHWVKKLGHFYFYCNFGRCWSIFKILSMSESERTAHNKNEKFPTIA